MKRTLLLGLVLFACAAAFAQNANVWMKRASFPGSKRARAVSFAIGSRGYIACGEDTLDLERNDLWEYDPGTDSWTQKSNLPASGRRDAVGFAIGNKGYVGTGMDAAESFLGNTLNDFWQYDPTTNTWTQKAPYPGNSGIGVYFATGFAVSGKGYVCGGKIGPSYYSSELWQYDPTTNSWLQKAYFPGGVRYGQASFTVGNIAYVGTGTDENWFVNEIYAYDPATNLWTAKAPLPASPRFCAFGFTIGNKGYITLGTDGGFRDELYEYDPPTNSWFIRASYGGEGRRSAAGFVIGNIAYVGTGKGNAGKHRDWWMYVPFITDVDENELHEKGLAVFPNPVSTEATIAIDATVLQEEKELRFELYDLTGKKIREQAVEASFTFERNDLPAGAYLGRLVSSTHVFATTKILVN